MQRPFEIKLRREMRNIISSHLKRYGDLANEAHAEDLVSDLMEAVKLEDYISMAQFEEYRDSWNKKYQELESSYIANINARDEEMEHSHRKIEELKSSMTNNTVKKILEDKLAREQERTTKLKQVARKLLEEI